MSKKTPETALDLFIQDLKENWQNYPLRKIVIKLLKAIKAMKKAQKK